MSRYPKIQSPCPYKGPLADIMDGDTCRLCAKPVIDLDALGDEARTGVVAGVATGRTGSVCVSYRLPAALAAAALAALGGATAAAAQDGGALARGSISQTLVEEVVVVGGISDGKAVAYHDAEPETDVAELPVVYDDPPAEPQAEGQ